MIIFNDVFATLNALTDAQMAAASDHFTGFALDIVPWTGSLAGRIVDEFVATVAMVACAPACNIAWATRNRRL